MQIAVEHHALHGLVVVKSASGPEEEPRLAREAAVLAEAGVPGVVELIDHEDAPGRAGLRTRHVGTRTSLALAGAPAATLARFGAGAAATLAALHARGISHNALDASHLLVGAGGEAVLCSLGHATGDAERWSGRIAFDPAEGGFEPAADVAALAELLDDLAGRGTGWRDAWARRRLRAALASVIAAPPGERASAAAVAATLAGLAGSKPPGPDRPGPDTPAGEATIDPLDPPTRSFGPRPGPATADEGRRPGRRRLVALVAVTASAGALAAAAAIGTAGGTGTAPAGLPAGPAASTTATDAPGDQQGQAALGDHLPSCTPDDLLDGGALPATCADQVVVEGRSLTFGTSSWEVGEEGDVVTVTDLGCDGTLEAVVLRPTTSDVFAFDGWAAPEAPVTASWLSSAEGAVAIAPGVGGCGLAATLADGSTAAMSPVVAS